MSASRQTAITRLRAIEKRAAEFVDAFENVQDYSDEGARDTQIADNAYELLRAALRREGVDG